MDVASLSLCAASITYLPQKYQYIRHIAFIHQKASLYQRETREVSTEVHLHSYTKKSSRPCGSPTRSFARFEPSTISSQQSSRLRIFCLAVSLPRIQRPFRKKRSCTKVTHNNFSILIRLYTSVYGLL